MFDEAHLCTTRRRDHGFSLVELLIVIVILGILSAVVVFAVGNTTADAQEGSCVADKYVLITASEAFFAQRAAEVIPDAGYGENGFEQTLVDEQFMRSTSQLYDLDASGALSVDDGSPCTV